MSLAISPFIAACAIVLCFFLEASAFQCAPKGSVKDAEKLQIHLVPHTHDDVGWLKTVDEYFYGANNSIQHAGVQYILDSVVQTLLADPNKRFIYVEIAFFERWWNEQTADMKEKVKKLVANRQLEFINAGWCMNDEAATHYNAIIDQMTLGLKFVEDTFGADARPRIAWHIDPFGHSSEQASLFSQMSFDGFFFGRIDYADKKKRVDEQRMEMVWRGSKNLGKVSDIFTGVLYHGYGPPPGFCFDQFCADPPIQDDSNLYDMNVKERVATFINETCSQAQHYRTNNIILTMGSDFQYENANLWFKNLDKLIRYVNQDGRVNAFYSTPSLYLDALHNASLTWEVKTDDFFPYADCPHCYWTGYFTSRPALKYYVRLNNNLLQACKQLEVIGGPFKEGAPSSDLLQRAMGVAQHHDAVSGTSKQHVADDYAKRLAIGAAECQVVIGGVLEKFTSESNAPPKMTFCNHLNISSCPVTEQSKSFTVTVYNPLARSITTMLRLPVGHSSLNVFSPQGKPVKSQVLPVSDQTKTLQQEQKHKSDALYELVFSAEAPPLGFATYFVNVTNSHLKRFQAYESSSSDLEDSDVTIENDYFRLVFSKDNGHVTSMSNLASGESVTLDQQFFWYNGSTGTKDAKQPSGAYIFRPNSSTPLNLSKGNKASISVFQGPLVQEVRQVFSPFVSQVIRLYTGQQYAEFEYTVGPIPVEDQLGKEIISRFDTDIKSNGLFYTDANGREMQERKRDFRPTWTLNNTEPVAGNYYPINSRVYIRDAKNQLNILTDRSLGGASLKDGSVEVMVHRRLLVDDKRGVGEPLNETGVSGKGLIIRGKFFVTLSSPETAGRLHRDIGEQQLLAPVLTFAPNPTTVEKWRSQYHSVYSGLSRELPANVHLLTVETMDNEALIRVEHQYEATEDAKLSKPVNISLSDLFTSFDIESVTEMNLAGNQLLKDKKRLQWNTKSGVEKQGRREHEERVGSVSGDLDVELSPMQIRTFKAAIKYKHGYRGKFSKLHSRL